MTTIQQVADDFEQMLKDGVIFSRHDTAKLVVMGMAMGAAFGFVAGVIGTTIGFLVQ